MRNYIFRSILIAAAYFIAGILGLKLAVPPGYATAVFPSSGIALAALLLFGSAYTPAIVVGSSVMNLYLAYQSHSLGHVSIMIGILIGFGAGFQALGGQFLIRRYVPGFELLNSEKQIFQFLLIAGPIASLINATWSVSTLSLFGVLSGQSFFFNWAMWFVGDAIGAMIFAPIILALAEKPLTEFNGRKKLIVLPSVMLFGFVVWFFFFSSHQLAERFKSTMQVESESSARLISESMEKYEVSLAAGERFFSSSELVTRDEFNEFFKNSFGPTSGIRAISWNPLVTEKNRERFEKEAKKQGYKNYQIVDTTDSKVAPARRRDKYYPIYYVEPFKENQNALGYDTYSSEVRRISIDKSAKNHSITVTPKIQLIQDYQQQDIPSIAMYYPVSSDITKKHLGFIVGVFKIEDVIRSALRTSHLQDLNYLVYDVTEGQPELLYKSIVPNEQALFKSESEIQKHKPREMFISKQFEIGDRKWLFELFPSKNYLSANVDLSAWTMLLGGLFVVILLQSLVMIIVGRTAMIQSMVDEKTLELSKANAELEKLTQLISSDLKQSNENFRQLAESMPQIVWTLDGSGKLMYVNDSWKDYTGVAFDEDRWIESVHPEDKKFTLNKFDQAFISGQSFELEYRLRAKSGAFKWFLARGVSIRDEQNNVVKWYGTSTDIDAQKKHNVELLLARQQVEIEKARLQKSEERLNMAMQSAEMGTWDWNMVTNEVVWSKSFCKIVGYEPIDDNINWEKYWNPLLFPEDLPFIQEKGFSAIRDQIPYSNRHRLIKADTKEVIWVDVMSKCTYDAEGKPLRMLGVLRNITQQIRSEQEKTLLEVREKTAVEASKLKSSFLANMSHEIRTPINGVIGMTSLLRETHLDIEQREFADNIHSSAASLLSIINDILDFSKVEAGKLNLEVIDFDLEKNIRDTFKTIEFLAKRKNLPLALKVDDIPTQSLSGDPGRLRQVLTNLLNNAVKFTHDGQVTLNVTRVKTDASVLIYRFEIQDTGIGIEQNSFDKIFQPFDQADTSTTRKFGGTGLGLSISKHLVELMQGEIGVKSEFGKGSTFWFEIPFTAGETSLDDLRNRDQISANMAQTGLRILLAEDNQINQMVAMKQLEKLGCRCDAVANGKEAIEALRNISYDLILMDCQMPELDGYEATRQIRAMNEKFSNIPIVAMTANAMKGDREKCLAAGMNDYVTKPISISDLSEVIDMWVRASHNNH